MSSNPLMMDYEGNRRSGVALAMLHRLCGLSTYGLKGQCVGDEHPAYAPGHGPFTLPRLCRLITYLIFGEHGLIFRRDDSVVVLRRNILV